MLSETDATQENAPAPPTARMVSLALPMSKPIVTWVLLAANVLVFVAMTLAGGSENAEILVRFGAKVNALIVGGEYWRFFTPMFIHIGIMHLAFNCYALYALGTETERLFGRAPFAALYLLAGFGGVVASFALNDHLSAGASGAIFGLIGALGYFFARHRNMLGQAGRRQLMNIALVAAYNLAFGFFYPGVDNHGHIGGLVTGVAVAWAICPDYTVLRNLDGMPVQVVDSRSPRRRLLLIVPVVLALLLCASAAVRVQSDSFAVRMDQGNTRLDAGDLNRALEDFTQAAQARPDSPDAHFMIGYVHFEQGDYGDAAASFEKAVSLNGDWGEARWNLALAYIRLGRYQDAAEHLNAYLALAGSETERSEAEQLLNELSQPR
jgi:rhomboid protease GluP